MTTTCRLAGMNSAIAGRHAVHQLLVILINTHLVQARNPAIWNNYSCHLIPHPSTFFVTSDEASWTSRVQPPDFLFWPTCPGWRLSNAAGTALPSASGWNIFLKG